MRRRYLHRASAASAVLAVVAWTAALTDGSADTKNAPLLRVTTRLVVVNVVVRDKHGAPIEGLARDDFTLLDGDRPQKISFFSVQSGRTLQQSLQLLPVNAYSNRVSREGDLPASATVILLDGLDTAFEDQVYARQQMIRFLSQLQPQDRVAVYVLGRRRLSVIQDLTTDPGPLLAALEHEQGAATEPGVNPPADSVHFLGLTGPAAAAAKRLDSGMALLTFGNGGGRDGGGWRTRDVFDKDETIEAIAHHLSGFPGRKSIIWLTDSVPAPDLRCEAIIPSPSLGSNPGTPGSDPRVEEKYWHMVRELNQDDVAIYPVDARGLFVDPTFSAESRSAPAIGSEGNALAAANCITLRANYLAQQTGGESFHGTNDLKGAIRKALDDAAFTYTLGYYPDHWRWDGSYRSIKVKVDVRGAALRYRQGYFALGDAPVEKSKDRVALIKEAADDPLEATAIALTVRATPFRGSRGEKMEVEVSVDPRDLEFEHMNGRWTGSFDVWAAQYSKQGRSVGAVLKTVSEKWKDATYQGIMQNGLTITNYESIKPESQELRVVVRDGLSGSIGSVRIPLHELSEQRPAHD